MHEYCPGTTIHCGQTHGCEFGCVRQQNATDPKGTPQGELWNAFRRLTALGGIERCEAIVRAYETAQRNCVERNECDCEHGPNVGSLYSVVPFAPGSFVRLLPDGL